MLRHSPVLSAVSGLLPVSGVKHRRARAELSLHT